jgi:hypothetical protein
VRILPLSTEQSALIELSRQQTKQNARALPLGFCASDAKCELRKRGGIRIGDFYVPREAVSGLAARGLQGNY